nr:MAG TPA: hypothetical protein [Caudoviricetes sp.]
MNERGYKAYNPGLICRGHKYEEDTVYKKNGHGICCSGVTHYCVNPFDTLDYYPLVQPDGQFSEFTTVEAIDEPVTGDGRKFATSTIKIGFKLGFKGFIQACVDFLYEKTIKEMPKPEDVDVSDGAQIGSSGDDAKIGSSGNGAQIGSSGNGAQIGSSGDDAQIGSSGYDAQIGSSGNGAKIGSSGNGAKIGSSGRYAKIGSSGNGAQIGSSGDDAQIGSSGNGAQIGSSGNGAQIGSSGDGAQIGSSGDGAQIGSSGRYAKIGSSGDDAQITVENANNVVACVGKRGRIKAPVGTWCTLAEYGEWIGEGCPCICVKSFEIDGETYKADTWYTLKDGEIVEVPEE